MKFLKKTGWFIVTMLPMVLSLLLQFGSAFIVLLFYFLSEMIENPGLAVKEAMNLALGCYIEKVFYVILIYHLVGVLVFGIWYYFAYGRKKRPSGTECPTIGKIGTIILLGICIQIFISCALTMISIINPELIQNYVDMMEIAGITDFNIFTILAVVFLAPIGEELMCRGITFRLAFKVSRRFWIANILQALAFGILHLSLVQGTYAFFIGLVLGYVYGKYRRIWICMLLHGVINGSSAFLDSYFSLYPDDNSLLIVIAHIIVSLLIIILSFKFLGKRKPLPQEE